MPLKVGELAKRSRVSVRTLHHYDEIELLSPSLRSESGHRLYTDDDVARLQQVISLRSLGFSLLEISDFLKARPGSPLQILEMHLEKLQQEAEERKRLIGQLEKIAGVLRTGQNPSLDELLKLIEGTVMIEKYYSLEQLDTLQERRNTLGESAIRKAEQDWVVLIDAAKKEMELGSDPASSSVQALARRWQALLAMFTGGDTGIANSCATMYREEGVEKASHGALDTAVFEYMGKAIAKLQDG